MIYENLCKVVFNKSEREYIPYDLAKKYMEQLVQKLTTQQDPQSEIR